jgi:hypothetical protein
VGKPATINADSWQKLYGAVATAIVSTFFNPKQVTMYADIFGKKLTGITISSFKAPSQPNWNGEVTDIVNLYQPYFVQATNTSAPADDGGDGSKAQNITDQTALAAGVLAGLGGIADADSGRSKGLGAGDTAVAAGTFIVNAIQVFGSGTKLADHQVIVDNVMASVQLVMAIADAVGAYKDYAEAIASAAKTVAGAADAEFLSQGALAGQPAFLLGTVATDEFGKLLTNTFDKGCGTFECGDVHGEVYD